MGLKRIKTQQINEFNYPPGDKSVIRHTALLGEHNTLSRALDLFRCNISFQTNVITSTSKTYHNDAICNGGSAQTGKSPKKKKYSKGEVLILPGQDISYINAKAFVKRSMCNVSKTHFIHTCI